MRDRFSADISGVTRSYPGLSAFFCVRGPKCNAEGRIAFQPVAVDQVEAIGDGGEDGLQAIVDRRRFARQVENQCLAAHTRRLARKNRCRHKLQRGGAHQLAETRQHLVADGFGRFRRHVAQRRAGTAGRNDQAAAFLIGQLDQRRLDLRLLIGNDAGDGFPRRGQRPGKPITDRRAAPVFVNALTGAIGNGQDADAG